MTSFFFFFSFFLLSLLQIVGYLPRPAAGARATVGSVHGVWTRGSGSCLVPGTMPITWSRSWTHQGSLNFFFSLFHFFFKITIWQGLKDLISILVIFCFFSLSFSLIDVYTRTHTHTVLLDGATCSTWCIRYWVEWISCTLTGSSTEIWSHKTCWSRRLDRSNWRISDWPAFMTFTWFLLQW